MRRPLAGVALCFVVGTWAGLAHPAPVMTGCALAAVFLLAALWRLSSGWATASLSVSVFLLAMSHASLPARSPSGRELSRILARPREYVELDGVVADDPAAAAGRREGEEMRKFRLRVMGVRRTESWQRARGEVDVLWWSAADARPAACGERWMLSGLLDTRGGRSGEGRPRPLLQAGSGEPVCVPAGAGWHPLAWCYRMRRACSRILSRGIESYPEHGGLLHAMLLGTRQDLPDRVRRAFARTGTLHVVAISGLHVAIVGSIALACLRGLGLCRTRWLVVLAPLLILYTVLTGLSVSAVRACVMAIAFWSAPVFLRKPDGPSSLATAALVILAWDPAQLADLGFLLSFSAVAGLMVFYPTWMRRAGRVLARDPLAVQEEAAWRRWLRSAALGVLSVAVASAAAWLATMPLVARCFHLVSPSGLLGNLLVVPASFAILLAGVLSLAAGPVSMVASEVLNHANRVLISVVFAWVEWVERIPGGFLQVRSPSETWTAAWYALLVLLLVSRGFLRRVVAGSAACVAVAAVLVWAGDRSWCVDVLDVGQGNAVFVNVPGDGDILVDAGPRRCGGQVVRHLREQGADRLRALVLSHGDADHVGGSAAVLRAFPVDELWCPPFVCGSATLREALAEARARGVRVRRLTAGERGEVGGGVGWEVLHPAGEATSRRASDVSLVIRLGRDAGSVLLAGGGEAVAESAVLSGSVEPSASVLIAGNHGSAASCSGGWLDAVGPARAVISVGADNAEGHPARATLVRLADRGIETWRTDLSGGVRIEMGGAWPAARMAAIHDGE